VDTLPEGKAIDCFLHNGSFAPDGKSRLGYKEWYGNTDFNKSISSPQKYGINQYAFYLIFA
jgi:hypothetical protein